MGLPLLLLSFLEAQYAPNFAQSLARGTKPADHHWEVVLALSTAFPLWMHAQFPDKCTF